MCAIAIDRGTCVGDAGLDFGRVRLRGAVGRDLVQSVGGHFGGGLKFEKVRVVGSSQKSSLQFDQGARSEPLATLVLSANARHLEEGATRRRQEH
jgi:hypothetical protein